MNTHKPFNPYTKFSIVKKSIISFLLIFSFTNITNLPIPYKYQFEALFLIIVFIFGCWLLIRHYFSERLFEKNTSIEKYVITVWILFVTSVLLTRINFNQPFIYGILSERRSITCLLGVILYWLLKKNYLNLKNLEDIFVFSFFIVLISYFLMNIFIPPSIMIETDIKDINQFASFSEQRGIYRYRFDMSLVVFGIIYAMSTQKKIIMKLFLISAIFYIFYMHRGRSIMITLSLIFFFYLVFQAKINTKTNLIFYILIIIFSIFLYDGFYSLNLTNHIDFFKYALAAISGETGLDVSANSRVYQTQIALMQLSKFHYFGVGVTSHQWELSTESLLGYFHPRDIGLLGSWFQYSILSIIAYFYITVKVLFSYYKIKKSNLFIKACYLYSLYMLIVSIATGWIFNGSSIGVFSIILSILAFDINQNKLVLPERTNINSIHS